MSPASRRPSKVDARAENPWFQRLDEQDWWQMNAFVNYLLLRILKLDSASASAAQVTDTQHRALLFVKGSPEQDDEGWVPLQALRRSLIADNATAAQLVGRIRTKGLLETRRPQRNGPSYVRLTSRGERALARVAERNRVALRQLVSEVGTERVPLVVRHILGYLEVSSPPRR